MGWTSLLAAIVLLPDGAREAAKLQSHDQVTLSPSLIAKLESARTNAAGDIKVEHTPFNFAANTGATFGDLE